MIYLDLSTPKGLHQLHGHRQLRAALAGGDGGVVRDAVGPDLGVVKDPQMSHDWQAGPVGVRLKMAIEIVDFPIENGGLNHSYVSLPRVRNVLDNKECWHSNVIN